MRPVTFEKFVGQKPAVEGIQRAISSSLLRGLPCPHILLAGPPGLGKTTIARIVAGAVGSVPVMTSGPALSRRNSLVKLLKTLKQQSVIFIDEVHRVSAPIAESLYSVMEDGFVELDEPDEETGATTLKLPALTIIGATTLAGTLPAPMLARFPVVERLRLYAPEELMELVETLSADSGLTITAEARMGLLLAGRGTPRVVINLFQRVRHLVDAGGVTQIAPGTVTTALANCGITPDGLNALDVAYLTALVKTYGGGPVGISAMSATLSEPEDALEGDTEAFLTQRGLIKRTSLGRIATAAGWQWVRERHAMKP